MSNDHIFYTKSFLSSLPLKSIIICICENHYYGRIKEITVLVHVAEILISRYFCIAYTVYRQHPFVVT